MLETNILDDGQATAQSGFDPLSASRFIKASGWINFLGILLYVLGGLFSLGFLVAIVFGASNIRGGGEVFFVFFLFMVIIAGMFIMGNQFMRLANATKSLRIGGVNRVKTDQICNALKGVFTTFGVFSLISIMMLVLALLFNINF
ncbi:MAG: hypothetical protein AAF544_08710 [Bacteroidota bacterium]